MMSPQAPRPIARRSTIIFFSALALLILDPFISFAGSLVFAFISRDMQSIVFYSCIYLLFYVSLVGFVYSIYLSIVTMLSEAVSWVHQLAAIARITFATFILLFSVYAIHGSLLHLREPLSYTECVWRVYGMAPAPSDATCVFGDQKFDNIEPSTLF